MLKMLGPISMRFVKSWIEQDFPGTYVTAPYDGDDLDALLANLNESVDSFAALVKSDPKLAGGFHIIGHSQGGLVSRAYVERYGHLPDYPKVINLISWLGVQDGTFGVPDFNEFCPDNHWYCDFLSGIVDSFLQDPQKSFEFQTHVTFAAYWKDVFNYQLYLDNNIFLADINNEKPIKVIIFFFLVTLYLIYLLL